MSTINLRKHIVKEIMTKEYPTISPSDRMADVCKTLTSSLMTGLPVVENKVVIGFISEKECLDYLLSISKYDTQYAFVKDYMNKDVKTMHAQVSLEVLIHHFKTQPYHLYPIEESGEIIGVIYRKTLIKYLNQMDRSSWSKE